MRRVLILNCCLLLTAIVGCGNTTDTMTTDDPGKSVSASGSAPATEGSTASAESAKPVVEQSTVSPGFTAPVVEGELTVANPAPKLALAEVVHGEPIEGFEKGKIYVVEFWATWCRPCLAGMPHISKLADKYRDSVHFVGVTNEDADRVKSFLEQPSQGKTWADVITYSLATDDNDKTNLAYMAAAGQDGIPTAFIVGRDGVVEWIGYPAHMDDVLAAVVENRFDRKGSYAAVAEQQVRKAAERKINEAVNENDFKTAIAEIDKLLKSSPEELNLSIIKMDLLRKAKMTDELDALQAQLVKERWDEPKFLEMIAWGIADENTATDLDLAMKAARHASELTKDSDPSILDTVARVFYAQENLQEAVNWQKKAVTATGNNGAGTDLGKTLQKYEGELEKKTGAKEPASDEDAGEKEEPMADEKPADEKSSDDKPADDKSGE